MRDMGTRARIAGLMAALPVALVAAGCGMSSTAGPPAPAVDMARGVAAHEPAVDPRPYGAADTAFGLDVLGTWCRADPGANLVLSPASLASGLGMAYLGSQRDTAQAMARVLHLPAAGRSQLLAGLRARSAALRGLSSPGVTVSASDQVWADPRLPLRAGYLNDVATGYDAGVAQVPLLSSPDRAAQEISQAVADATRGHIPQLLPPGSLGGIAWVLTDALYLNAAWARPFQASETSSGPFTTAAGQQVSAKFMNGGGYRAATAGGWTAVSLPYQGGTLTMVALLPAPGAGSCAMPTAGALAAMTTSLGAGGTARPGTGSVTPGTGSVTPGTGSVTPGTGSVTPGTGSATPGTGSPAVPGAVSARAAIALPKVDLSTRASMADLLKTLGMGIAFSAEADFGGMSRQACCIGLVEHAATLQVGEKGTVASAATAVGITPTAGMGGPVVDFDRPYLLLVTDTATGDALFAARVADPAAH